VKRRRELTPKLNYRVSFRLFSEKCLIKHSGIIEEEEFITNWDEVVESFDDMGLKEGVLRGIYGHGFVKPSPIQQKGILPVIQGKDTIAQVNLY
jgi:translation initiation factor 4A